jgi:hypothetical protein
MATFEYCEQVAKHYGFKVEKKNVKWVIVTVGEHTKRECKSYKEAIYIMHAYNEPVERFRVALQERMETRGGLKELAKMLSNSTTLSSEDPFYRTARNAVY